MHCGQRRSNWSWSRRQSRVGHRLNRGHIHGVGKVRMRRTVCDKSTRRQSRESEAIDDRGAVRLLLRWVPRLSLRIPLVGHIRVGEHCRWRRRRRDDIGVQARSIVLRERCGVNHHLGAVVKTIIVVDHVPLRLVKGGIVGAPSCRCKLRFHDAMAVVATLT